MSSFDTNLCAICQEAAPMGKRITTMIDQTRISREA